MRGMIRGAGPAAVLAAVLVALLAAGCSGGRAAPYRATVDTCYAFGVRAVELHVIVTTVPRACAGLSHAQVNLAVARAVRDAAGPAPKALARRRAVRESRYLAHLINTLPPPRPAPQAAAAPAGRSTDLPLSLAALGAWILTAAAGSYLLAGWLAHGGLRLRRPRTAGTPPLIIISHFGLALAGLAIWVAFVASGLSVLARIDAGLLLLPVAGLGMATLVSSLPEPAASSTPAAPRPERPADAALAAARPAPAAIPGAAGPGPPSDAAPDAAPSAAGRARPRIPVAIIAAHGVLATATMLLVLLAAIAA